MNSKDLLKPSSEVSTTKQKAASIQFIGYSANEKHTLENGE